MKYIFVTGGVLSGLGKGIATSSIGLLLKRCGYKVTAIKIDPYLNCDAGTMNPYEHGEVFVLHDGGEVDLDLGNYERFLDTELSSEHNITTGKVYLSVIDRERKGDYLGKTVQIIPHIVNEIKTSITRVAVSAGADVCMVEMGGTVGDIESMPFLEAARQMHMEHGPENVIFVHTTLIPIMGVVGEQKTKPTQHSVKELRSIGIQPNIIVGRCSEPLDASTKEKISLFCNVRPEAVISAHDLKNTYKVPLLLQEQNVVGIIHGLLRMKEMPCDMEPWSDFVDRFESSEGVVRIAIVGKYTGLKDSYISHYKAFEHAGAECGVNVELEWIDAPEAEHDFEKEKRVMLSRLAECHGILVPGGFGSRGTRGKLEAVRFARENDVPFLGICLGLQIAVTEFARNVMGLEKANSTEFDPDTPHPVVDILPEQLRVKNKGGTMRLGAQKSIIRPGTLAYRLYGKEVIYERHRHRYEINPAMIESIERAGWVFSAVSDDGIKMEIGELPGKLFHIGSQFHPEFLSHPNRPAPLFLGLVRAAVEFKEREAGS
ncbi:MAG: CTP synthase (glutamine hydrolyzing) [Candidatus Thermoplasmatota archaeon]|nr:CTP synthase (glutamine hydrolyzing) [Candidatus Thermoplasmatota archaeon]